ncbi:MAG: 50S ribosomal protein L9 [Candidatus Yanofskybacteria bacterium]|nr:50S ribosomal protein L9 [Candidatus Yanofskybacteria bacterium]
MRVILLQNIKGFGQIGDVKNVSDGYGRNFLLPGGKAKLATPNSLKEVDNLKKKLSAMQEVEKETAVKVAEQLKDLTVEITRKATKTGKLFAGIDKDDLVKEIKKASGVSLKEEMIDHEEPIKQVGEHLVDLNLSPEVKTQIKVLVKTE